MLPFFIAAPGTGIGKTLVTTALCWQLCGAGKNVIALKPIISGYDANDAQSDTALILKSCAITPSSKAVDEISPWRFKAPLPPDMAAEQENKPPVDLDELVTFCRNKVGDYTIIETIGGVMTPINNHHTVLDWMSALNWPVVLVTGSYLGAISHTLMTLEVLRSRGLRVKMLIVSESEGGVSPTDTATTLEKFLLSPIPVVKIPRIVVADEPWQHVPDLSEVCA